MTQNARFFDSRDSCSFVIHVPRPILWTQVLLVRFLRHEGSFKTMGEWAWTGARAGPHPGHRLDEPRRAIPWRVARRQSSPPLHPARKS
jgi:hypothetical protein